MENWRKKKGTRREQGITLIALVVTVVVLLILARSEYFDVNW